MRTFRRRARWLAIAVALSCLAPAALADNGKSKQKQKKPKISECTKFEEIELSDDAGVDFQITNSCEARLSCGVKWTLTCAPGTKRAKKSKNGAAFEIESGMSDGTTATTEEC